jgi:hypothetical protein
MVDNRIYLETVGLNELGALMSKINRSGLRGRDAFREYTRLPFRELESGRLDAGQVRRKARVLKKVWNNARRVNDLRERFHQSATACGQGWIAKAAMMKNMEKLRWLESRAAENTKAAREFAEAAFALGASFGETKEFSRELEVVRVEMVTSLSAIGDLAMELSRCTEDASQIASRRLAGESPTPPAAS